MTKYLLIFLIAIIQTQSSSFPQSWMEEMYPILQNQTLLDISLPGAHDSLTSDLSTTFSDNAEEIPTDLSYIMHSYGHLIPTVGDFGRNQSKTQGLPILDQLNSGIRFIDFRIIHSRVDLYNFFEQDWFCLHFMQTNNRSLQYLQQIRDFLDTNQKEIVVLWLSKHGNECLNGTDQYPNVTPKQKQHFFGQIQKTFDGMLFNNSQFSLNTTTIKELVESNQRVIIFAGDYSEFTGNSEMAIDACKIYNEGGSGIDDDEQQSFDDELAIFQNASVTKQNLKSQNMFYLRSMATSGPSQQILAAFELTYLPFFNYKKNKQTCKNQFPSFANLDFCPLSLQQISQWTNYYKQLSLDVAHQNEWDFPNAIYIDAIDYDGTIRTGTLEFGNNVKEDGDRDGDGDIDTQKSRFAYVDTLLLGNWRRVCKGVTSQICQDIFDQLSTRKAKYPVQTWNDTKFGRMDGWPKINQQILTN